MALTNVNAVLRIAGLDEPEDFRFFRFSAESELHDYADECVAMAAAYVKGLVGATTYGTTDSEVKALLTRAEAYVAAIHLVKTIEARKVYGSHYAVQSEDSTGYAGLIEQWEGMVERLLEPYATLEGETPIALPAMAITTGVDRSQARIWPDLLQDELDVSRGLIGEESLA